MDDQRTATKNAPGDGSGHSVEAARTAEQLDRIAALRLQGKTWLEISAGLQIDYATLCKLRAENGIDARISEAARDAGAKPSGFSPAFLAEAKELRREARRAVRQRLRAAAEPDPIGAAIARAKEREAAKSQSATPHMLSDDHIQKLVARAAARRGART